MAPKSRKGGGRARKSARAAASAPSAWLERVARELDRYADGVHQLGNAAPAAALTDLPSHLADFLRWRDGAELFHETLQLWPARSPPPHTPGCAETTLTSRRFIARLPILWPGLRL